MARNELNWSRSLGDWLQFAGVEDAAARQRLKAFFHGRTTLPLGRLAGSLLAHDLEVREFVQAVIERFMLQLPTDSFLRLGLRLRKTDQRNAAYGWLNLNALRVRIYLTFSRDRYAAMLLSFHPNGRIRESAVRFLGKIKTGEELRFLLFRQNDWVPKVSRLAKSLVQKRLRPGYLEHFVDQPALLATMLRWRRNDLSNVFNQLVDLLVLDENRTHLRSVVENCRGKGGRTFFAKLLATENADVVRLGAASEDHIVCCKSMRHALNCLSQEECLGLANEKLRAKQAIVRVAANELKAASESVENRKEVWISCLFDHSQIVRRTAAFYLNKIGCNLAELCRIRLEANPSDFAAIALLADEGDSTDVELFQAVLDSDPAPRLRVEAIRGIGVHGRFEQVAELQKYLCSPNTNTVRMARRQLMPMARDLEAKRVGELVSQCQNPLGKLAIVQLVAKGGFWRSLPWQIEAIAGDDSVFADAALDMVRFYTGCGRFVPPTSSQRADIQESLARHRSQFSSDVAESLGFYLGGFGFSVGKKEE